MQTYLMYNCDGSRIKESPRGQRGRKANQCVRVVPIFGKATNWREKLLPRDLDVSARHSVLVDFALALYPLVGSLASRQQLEVV
ncbi:hypothetical protein [Vibrio phage VP16T]|nr:hypothetical protein [Vibrio phage VP16T]